ncbi:MAG: helix-turn-helix transcriptional regulator [Bacilli bacterium]|nr:helix-turn-helix transcriptional regulator [Bacilli bacterium]
MRSKVNERLQNLRIQHAYTYQNMADKLHICKAFYWQIEHNNRRVQYKLAKEIAAIFHLKPDDIFYHATN